MLKEKELDLLDPKEFIIIKNARVNNLKNLSVAIPRNKLIVITGLSGSGKSSLAFDTLFAEGQRMYVESLSSYARQFLGRMEKPEVDYIKGVAPAIAIEQKVSNKNPRSTVGTTTEIYDYLKLLFARVGDTFSPTTGEIVTHDTVSSVVDAILLHPEGTRFMVSSPLIVQPDRTLKEELNILLSKGYTRVLKKGQPAFIEDLLEQKSIVDTGNYEILIDRAVVENQEDAIFRFSDSVQTAFFEGHGDCFIHAEGQKSVKYSDKFEADGITFELPTTNLFSFNNPYGACKRCEGFGRILGIDPDLVIPDKNATVYDRAIMPWRGETMKKWLEELIRTAPDFNFPIHKPILELTAEQYELLWTGNQHFKGLNAFFKHIEGQTHKIQYRVMLSRYRGRTACPECRGTRLRKDAGFVKIAGRSIIDMVLLPIDDLASFINGMELSEHKQKIADRLIKEIKYRLSFLQQVGLGYLTLNRLTGSLSGGEFQRIKLATSLGSALVGSMYILDEPSIGLHPKDTSRLINVLQSLKKIGNTVIVVEHEEEVMQAADQIIDIGPDAGAHGGQLIFQGTIEEIRTQDVSHTSKYLSGKDSIEIPKVRRPWKDKIIITGAQENNLKNIDVEIPLNCITTITGVSGSGKSTLVKKIIYPAIGKLLGTVTEATGKYRSMEGDYAVIDQIEYIDQNPIGKSSRSNPVTYVKAYDVVRQLFSEQTLAKQRGYKPAFFSFNVDGGRCDNCQGEGTVKVEMQFMADIYLTCDECEGHRFKKEILEITYKEKNIFEVLDLTVAESLAFFADKKSVFNKIKPLDDVGLGYIKLGQSSNSLSGGEAQRVKLAYFLGKHTDVSKKNILFIFDEPTTGLHFHDIDKLMQSINALVEKGNSMVIIEHNMDVIKLADWVIDLGPDGGINGGNVAFQGTPEDLIKLDNNHTAKYLKEKMHNNGIT